MGRGTAALSVSLDVGDRLAKEFRSLGANLLVTPQADSLPLEIGGVDYRPVDAGAYLPESDLPKLKTIFWHNNIIAFAPVLRSVPRLCRLRSKMGSIGSGIGLRCSSSLERGLTMPSAPGWREISDWNCQDEPLVANRRQVVFRRCQECVVGATFAQKYHIKIGDSVSLATGDVTKIPAPLKVTAILTSGGPEMSLLWSHSPAHNRYRSKPGEYESCT